MTSCSPSSRPSRSPDLEARLRDALGILPAGEKFVFLKADATLPYADVGRVLAACHRTGAAGVTLLTNKKS
jgi:biopolymer transport protein ExbD